ncbi:hypothetical protein QT981_20510, partial [Microcoleus sp. herbarium13]
AEMLRPYEDICKNEMHPICLHAGASNPCNSVIFVGIGKFNSRYRGLYCGGSTPESERSCSDRICYRYL